MKDFILKGIIPGFFRVLCLAINIVILFNSLVLTVPLNLESAVKIEIINAWGFIGTIETGAEADTCTFKEGEQISVVCEDNVSIVQKDGSIFAFNEMDPNVDESDLEVGDFVWVGFRTYDYLEGNGMYNQVFPYHVSINPLQ